MLNCIEHVCDAIHQNIKQGKCNFVQFPGFLQPFLFHVSYLNDFELKRTNWAFPELLPDGTDLMLGRSCDKTTTSSLNEKNGKRRCSVNNLDIVAPNNSSAELLSPSRKRMSSFPPSENSETTQVLVEIHRANSKMDLDQTGTGREGAKSVSPCRSFISLLGVARAKKACSQWKSSTDIFKESQG